MVPMSSFERLGTICADVGLDLERIRPSIVARMRLLAETTETVNDCERAVRIANDISATTTSRSRSSASLRWNDASS